MEILIPMFILHLNLYVNGEIYKGDIITTHEYTVSQSEIDKYSEVTTEDSEENKEKAKQEDTNNYYLIEKVY